MGIAIAGFKAAIVEQPAHHRRSRRAASLPLGVAAATSGHSLEE
ncbi:hypothetical protein FP2506_02215 [Fulvimarina pelagi HTCC2506]|uniref:Uncharacterized protein n=1 Tax=Fulvimarina pelagi HTCC2506 TaxID=314231 RepID=Q0FYH7_9HYPH|nr:hypothetical protein FP2506_02215 [Fulvimarina pelagi HTCC2506]